LIDNNQQASKISINSDEMNHYFTEDKGKAIDISNLSINEINRRALANQPTGLTDITPENFDASSNAVLGEISQFLDYQERSAFPKDIVKTGLFSLISERLYKLSQVNAELYSKLINDDSKNNLIEKFLSFRNELLGEEIDKQSNSYEEVAKATIQEQEV
jgi:hypothetical protein